MRHAGGLNESRRDGARRSDARTGQLHALPAIATTAATALVAFTPSPANAATCPDRAISQSEFSQLALGQSQAQVYNIIGSAGRNAGGFPWTTMYQSWDRCTVGGTVTQVLGFRFGPSGVVLTEIVP